MCSSCCSRAVAQLVPGGNAECAVASRAASVSAASGARSASSKRSETSRRKASLRSRVHHAGCARIAAVSGRCFGSLQRRAAVGLCGRWWAHARESDSAARRGWVQTRRARTHSRVCGSATHARMGAYTQSARTHGCVCGTAEPCTATQSCMGKASEERRHRRCAGSRCTARAVRCASQLSGDTPPAGRSRDHTAQHSTGGKAASARHGTSARTEAPVPHRTAPHHKEVG